ncbi:MAG: PD40 domain-containing protein [Acidobacteria bacterium]|nr:PD40 domain-containing protein [Acidobacteriota bacterium]
MRHVPCVRRGLAVAAGLLVSASAGIALAQPATPILLSPALGGTAAGNRGAGQAYLGGASISADGRRVAFASASSDLVANDVNGTVYDVFVRDLGTNTTIAVSVTASGATGNGESGFPTISPDGSLVVFQSDASNLVPGDTNGVTDVFVRDLSGGTTQRVSIDERGAQATAASGLYRPSAISDDGRRVVFASSANLRDHDTSGYDDLYLHDRFGNTELLTYRSNGVGASSYPPPVPVRHLSGPVISRDGKWLAFESLASDLVEGDTNGSADLFLRHVQRESTIRICVNPRSGSTATADVPALAFSADARYAVFACASPALGPTDMNGATDIFRRDLVTGEVLAVSVRSDGLAMADGPSAWASVSADGRFVVFRSSAADVVPGVSGTHVYVRDMTTGVTSLVDASPIGTAPAQVGSVAPSSISDDGRYVLFVSYGALASGAVQDLGEAYVRDRETGTTRLVSTNITLASSQFQDVLPGAPVAVSRDGSTVVFESYRTNHATVPDTNDVADLFAARVAPGTWPGGQPRVRLSVSDGGQPAVRGERITYTLDVTNQGTATYPGGTLRLTVPGNTRWQPLASSQGWRCVPDGEAYSSCDIAVPPLGLSSTHQVQFAVLVDDDGRNRVVTMTAAIETDIATEFTAPPSCLPTGPVGAIYCCLAEALLLFPTEPAGRARAVAPLTDADLETLYVVRDRIMRPTPNGQHYSDLYYGYRNEVRDTIVGDAALFARAGAILDDWMPGLDALANGQGDSVIITPQRVATLVAFLNDVAAAAPAALRTVILDELTRFPADDLAGQSMSAAARRLGVHDGGLYKRYFAEGATGTFFRTALALSNAASTAVDATIRFLTTAGNAIVQAITVPGFGHATVDVGTVPGLEAAEFSTVVESALPLTVDRTLTWDVSRYGSHTEASLAAPSLTWYLAEGATHSGFDLFYLLQNPDPARSATVTVRYLRPSGAPLSKTYTVAAGSRANIWVNQEEFDVAGVATRVLASTDVSAVFTVANDVPIIVERALYRSTGGLTFGAGHESAGVTAPARQWFLAEGATGDYFDLFVLVANPTDRPARIRARYLLPSGQVLTKEHDVAANSRFNLWVDQEELPAGSGLFPLADTAVSTTIESLDDVPVIVERAMWWPGTAATWYEAHNSPGATSSGLAWAVADGEVGGPSSIETYILIANVSSTPGTAKVTLLFDDGSTSTIYVALPANSRNNVSVRDDFPQVAGKRFGVLVESVGEQRAQLVVERAVYGNANGDTWTAGSNALATRLR